MATFAEAKESLAPLYCEGRKLIYNRLMLQSFDDLEPSHPRVWPLSYLERGRRKSFSYRPRRNKPYKYRPLPSSRSIRVLQLQGLDEEKRAFIAVLTTRDVDSADYAALSYTWGPANDGWEGLTPTQEFSPRYSLLVVEEESYNMALLDQLKTPQMPNESFVPDDEIYSITIRQNLSDFLHNFLREGMALRVPESAHGLWIDAVCINQEDPNEKETQISLMGDIYSNAATVIAWLGNAPPQLDTVVWMNDCFFPSLLQRRPAEVSTEDFLLSICRGDATDANFWLAHTGLQPKEHDWLTCWHVLLRFLERTRWFRRCWIMQEFCLARQCACVCGTSVFLPNFLNLLYLRTVILRIEHAMQTTYNLESTLTLFSIRITIHPWANRPGSLFEHFFQQSPTLGDLQAIRTICLYLGMFLKWTRSRDTSLEMDRVYSVVGLLKKLLGDSVALSMIRPRPNRPISNSFTWAAALLLENDPELDLLSSVEARKSSKHLGLPSWVPDFSTPLGHSYRITDFKKTGLDATLVDQTRSRPPGMEVRGKLLRVSGRKIGQVRSWLHPLTDLALLCIGTEDEEFWNSSDIEVANGDTMRLILQQYASFVSHRRLSADEFLQFRKEKEKICSNNKYRTEIGKFYEDLLNAEGFEDVMKMLGCDFTIPEALSDMRNQHALVERRDLISSRSPSITWNGLAGFGPHTMESGDGIWLLEGGRVPYILRKNPSLKHFTFVGECLVFGVMRGELMTDDFRAGFQSIEIR